VLALGIGPGIAVGILLGALIGLTNGTLIARYRLPPFIVTLGMLSFCRGIAYVITGGLPVLNLPREFAYIGEDRLHRSAAGRDAHCGHDLRRAVRVVDPVQVWLLRLRDRRG
jgi:ribose/xylose/arabinose/galactoside ABC-type transport system permease subunit